MRHLLFNRFFCGFWVLVLIAFVQKPLAQTYDIISDRTAVQAILDSNGMTTTSWGDVSVVRNNRIAELTLNGIHVLPDTIKVLTALEKLSISNSLTVLPKSLGQLHQLRTLTITRCSTALPDTMSLMDSLRVIRLYETTIKKFPITLLCPPRLDSLFITRAIYDTLPVSIFGIASLKSLAVDSAPISYISNDIGDSKSLTSLTITNEDRLSVLPDSIGALVNLRTFNASGNPRLSALPLSICNLKKLTSINVYHDSITFLPECLATLPLLDTLDIEFNDIVTVPEAFSSSSIKTIFPGENAIDPDSLSSSLLSWMNAHAKSDKAPGTWDENQNLYYNLVTDRTAVKAILAANWLDTSKVGAISVVRKNRIVKLNLDLARSLLPDTLRTITALESLTVASRSLVTIPDAIGSLSKLIFLKFSQSSFGKLPDAICNLKKLQVLECDSNGKFSALPDSIGKLTNLTRLSLHGDTSFSKIPQSICNCKKLKTLDFEDCALSWLPACFGYLDSLSSINVHGNRLITLPSSLTRSKTQIRPSNNYICPNALPSSLYQWINDHEVNDPEGRWYNLQKCESYNDISLTNDHYGWIVASGGSVLRLADNDTDWTRVGNLQKDSITAVIFTDMQGDSIADAVFTDSLHGWIASKHNHNGQNWDWHDHYYVFSTSDGAKTWVKRMDTETDHGGLLSIFFINNMFGWAVGGDNNAPIAFGTKDGAITWVPQDSSIQPQDSGWAANVFFTDQLYGWIAGQNGLILSTTDGGTTWTKQVSGTSNNLNRVFFIGHSKGWAVGDSLTILKTINGGTTWESQSSPANRSLRGLFFIDSTRGWTVGDSGTILRTVDGGNYWGIVDYGTKSNLKSIAFTDSLNGWIVGANATIIHITDGGKVGIQRWGSNSFMRHPLSIKITAHRSGILYVKYNLPARGTVQLTITDIMGRLVARQEQGMCETGSGIKQLTAQRLAQGYYFVSLRLTTEKDKIVSAVRSGFVMAR
jgi:photosystem II stability/assembly factor-like uncharacterized protein